jgi:hypothetical protein
MPITSALYGLKGFERVPDNTKDNLRDRTNCFVRGTCQCQISLVEISHICRSLIKWVENGGLNQAGGRIAWLFGSETGRKRNCREMQDEFGSLLPSFEEGHEELEGMNAQIIVRMMAAIMDRQSLGE